MVKVLVPIADGCEDIETSCITDVLARAGVEVVTSSVMTSKHVTFARGLKVEAQTQIDSENPEDYDAVILPGGPGAKHLGESKPLAAILHSMKSKKKLYGAICASPVVVLSPNNLLDGVKVATCFPMMQSKLTGVEFSPERVVVSNGCITSQGPGTAIEFALTIAAILVSPEKAKEVAEGMLVQFTLPKL